MKANCYIRGLEIGTGEPKIVLPISEHTEKAILEKAKRCVEAKTDLIEWRVDAFESFQDPDHVNRILKGIRKVIGNVPLIFTFRTQREGGNAFILPNDYRRLNLQAAKSGIVDFVDVEIETEADGLIEAVHEAETRVIASFHDFNGTPDRQFLLEKFKKMQAANADVLKIAVMPKDAADVSDLLWASSEMHLHYADRPLIAISMGALGVVSRISGEIFGSSMTFGALGSVSAPGQIEIHRLRDILKTMHQLNS
ncbi:MAG: 3-dehydroquinate dehydratase [Clostridiales bacterium]|jgi:3-dehydroquinate dehydratase-1|nr:3-dehydroquinate dehydratase [Clostridiales bacterium]